MYSRKPSNTNMTKSRIEASTKNAFARVSGDFRFGTTPGGGFPAGVNDGSKTADEEAIET